MLSALSLYMKGTAALLLINEGNHTMLSCTSTVSHFITHGVHLICNPLPGFPFWHRSAPNLAADSGVFNVTFVALL